RRCGTSVTSRDDADGPAPPQPFGQQGFALASFVARRQRWTRLAFSSRLAGERRSLLRDPREFFSRLLDARAGATFEDFRPGASRRPAEPANPVIREPGGQLLPRLPIRRKGRIAAEVAEPPTDPDQVAGRPFSLNRRFMMGCNQG